MALLRLSRRALLAAELQHAEPKEATYRSPSKTLVPLTESNARLLNASQLRLFLGPLISVHLVDLWKQLGITFDFS